MGERPRKIVKGSRCLFDHAVMIWYYFVGFSRLKSKCFVCLLITSPWLFPCSVNPFPFVSYQGRRNDTFQVETQRFSTFNRKPNPNVNQQQFTATDFETLTAGQPLPFARFACGFASSILSSLTILALSSFAYRAQTQNTAYRNTACDGHSVWLSVSTRTDLSCD